MKDDATTPDQPMSMTGSSGSGAVPDFTFWISQSSHVLDRWTQSSADMMKGAADLAQEIMSFSHHRFQADLDAWKALTACRNPGDLFACQKQFGEKATVQYFDEVTKLGARLTSMMAGAATSSRQGQTSKA